MKRIFSLLVFTLLFIIPANAEWKISSTKDEMTGEQSFFAISSPVSATKKMSFPYENTKAWLAVGYDGEKWWTYFGFNTTPNILRTETRDGYNIINTRLKWDDEIEEITLTQDWSSRFLFFRSIDAKEIISKITDSNSALLELQWYNQEIVYFRFPLKGSANAIKQLQNKFNN